MRKNVASSRSVTITHEGGPAKRIYVESALRRSVSSCLLWESEFYEDGDEIAGRIESLVAKVSPEKVAALAIEARSKLNLRHVPLWLVACMARLQSHRPLVRSTTAQVIQRADEMGEILNLYWGGSDRRGSSQKKIPSSLRRGVADAFSKFDAYKLGKYNRKDGVRLKDVLRLCRPRPSTDDRAELYRSILDGTLQSPDTWEVALSGGADKRETWERLITEKKIGALALLRNLRNMQKSNVPLDIIRSALAEADVSRVLPFRFIAAARFAPAIEPQLEQCMFRSLVASPRLGGNTAILVDVSGSMDYPLSTKSDMRRMDAACGLAMVLREVCDSIRVFAFSDRCAEIPARRGFSLRDAIVTSMPHSSTCLGDAVRSVNKAASPDRLVVVTDEQTRDQVGRPHGVGYMINVASAENGVGYGSWNHIDGFSESVVRWIVDLESR